MSARRSKGPSSGGHSFQNYLITFLLLIVVAESFLLARSYLQKISSHPKPARISAQTATARPPAVSPAASLQPEEKKPALATGALPLKPSVPGHSGRIVIIVDDSGYNLQDCDYLREIAAPITVSILPELKYSKAIDTCAHNYGKEIMLHLPLEPYENEEKYPDNYIIKTTMSARQIVERFYQAMKTVPHCAGINNHMGSKATENLRLMSIIFTELKSNSLFFVDSKVTPKSICRRVAGLKGVAFSERDVFLDNENNRTYIEGQFQEVARRARQRGHAVAIGHARSLTWEIIKEQSERLTQQGFEFVTVKQLLNKP